MNKIIKARWAIFVLWLIAVILLTSLQPDINAILQFRGQQPLSQDSPSVMANSILSKMDTTQGTNDLIVFFDKNKLSDEEMDQIKTSIKTMTDSSSELGISHIIDPFSTPEAKSSLLSKDGTTLMVSFKLDKGTREVDDIAQQLDSKLSNVKAEHYLSGEDFISNDYLKKALGGVDKSAVLTVIFILLVLIVMFRSIVTPLISLIAVGFTYLCSMGIAAQLIDKANFPITSLTQVLLVLILFGIGTDYNILLFNRFKGELSQGHSVDHAIVNTYKTAGKTIAFSLLTIFIAFLSLVFAKSPIYQSGVVVVIGAAILLLEILTLMPFMMKVFGKKLFWPSNKIGGHGENKFWGKTSTFATKRPIISILVILVLLVPTVILHQQKLSSDNIAELGDSAPSTKGFNLVSEHFGKGQAMPTTVIIENDKALDNNEALSAIDSLTDRIKNLKGVEQVSSVTQPEGKPIDDFYISGQMGPVTDGISKTQVGVDQINDGLKLAADSLGSADFSQVGQMVDGTAKLQAGQVALSNGLKQIQNGIGDGSSNPKTIQSGIATIQTNLAQMSSGLASLSDNYGTMQAGYAQTGANYQQMAQALMGVKSALSPMQAVVSALGNSYSGAQSDTNYLTLKGTIDQLIASLSQITPEGIATLNENYNALTTGFGQANAGLQQMSSGLAQMAVGLKQLESGLATASSGIGTIVTNMNGVADGLGQMKSGQQQLVEGLNGFSTFGQKLSEVNGGLKQISDGLGQTNDFLTQLNSSKTFFIPKEALTNADFTKALDNFMNNDRTITKMMVVLKDDPYSPAALDTIQQINGIAANAFQGTVLSKAQVGVTGPSATAYDINKILNSDLNRMTVIVLIGVLLVLLLVTRSLWESMVITVSLWGAYYAAMFVLNFIFLDLKGLPGVQSFVPFFAFIVIVALGVDYSIFLMMRFKEYPHMPHKEAIVLASKQTGGVIMSAVIILGGTFATLIPSGFSILVQLAVAVITGLIVLCFIMLPIFLPAMIALPSALVQFSKDRKASRVEEA